MLVLAAERAWDEGNEGLVKKGGETAADRGHGRRGEVAINKYTERTGGVRGRERERERGGESGRSSHEEAREREKYRGMRIVGERKRRRAKRSSRLSDRPSVRSCPKPRPQSPHESNRRSFEARERERESERKGDGERKRDRGIRYGSWWNEMVEPATRGRGRERKAPERGFAWKDRSKRREGERRRATDNTQGCERRSGKRVYTGRIAEVKQRNKRNPIEWNGRGRWRRTHRSALPASLFHDFFPIPGNIRVRVFQGGR